ncbi:MAG TPA: hypothetical protein VHV81_00300 [Steroidobacteraceae bacterium]|jgi:hypothetical protein|nr:hypothetical protein [Steroidobacteraceae bacterium]
MPRAFGEDPELGPDPEILKKLEPPSVFAEYKVLTAVFLAAGVVLAFYFVKWVYTAPPHEPPKPARESVYIDVVPAPAPAAPAPTQPAKEPAKGSN